MTSEMNNADMFKCRECKHDLNLTCIQCGGNPNTDCVCWPVTAVCLACTSEMTFDGSFFTPEEVGAVVGENDDTIRAPGDDFESMVCDGCDEWTKQCICAELEAYAAAEAAELAHSCNLCKVEPDCKCMPTKFMYCPVCHVERKSTDVPWTWEPGHDPTAAVVVNIAHCDCTPQPTYACTKCHVRRSNEMATWDWMFNYPNGIFKPTSYTGGTYGGGWTEKCRHYHIKVTLSDGHVVRCSSMDEPTKEEEIPDFGLYLDSGWARNAKCRNEMINFPDMQIPKHPELAAVQILDAWDRIVEGQDVEIGCIGGHGRTGTVLACFAVLAGDTPEEARTFVWDKYCKEAIESKKQEWWVDWFHAYINDIEAPPMPIPPPPKVYTTTSNNGPVKIIKAPTGACGRYCTGAGLGKMQTPCMFVNDHAADQHSWKFTKTSGQETLGSDNPGAMFCGEITKAAIEGCCNIPCEFAADHGKDQHSWVWLHDSGNLTFGDQYPDGIIPPEALEEARLVPEVDEGCAKIGWNVHIGLINTPCEFDKKHFGSCSWLYIKVANSRMTLGEYMAEQAAIAAAAVEYKGTALAPFVEQPAGYPHTQPSSFTTAPGGVLLGVADQEMDDALAGVIY